MFLQPKAIQSPENAHSIDLEYLISTTPHGNDTPKSVTPRQTHGSTRQSETGRFVRKDKLFLCDQNDGQKLEVANQSTYAVGATTRRD